MRKLWSTTIRVLFIPAIVPLAGLRAPAMAQAQESTAEGAAADAPAAAVDPALFDELEWRNIGPERGGRSIAVGASTARPLEYYFGATGGGLWKTTDAGQTWEPVADEFLNSSSVGAIGVCEADPDVVFIGMGEVQLRGNIIQGDGVYKTTDGGETWEHLGLEDTHAVARIRVHPQNCERAYVAALGHPYGPNEQRGVFRTDDGGGNWERVHFVDDQTGAVDLSIEPNNPDVMYAGFWHVYRRPWKLNSGGPGSGLWKSADGGATWQDLTENPGMPEAPIGKVGVSVSPVDPNRVFAIIEAQEGGVFRSDDAGATWERVNDSRDLRQRAFYYTRIYADTQDRDIVYVLNVDFWKSTDGGEEFDIEIDVPHGDNHDLWIAADDNQRMISANDGGANVSFNGGETWTEQDFPTAQMYNVFTTNHEPYHVCGAQQDNSTACVPSEGWEHYAARGPNHGYYYAVGGGESGYIAPHPTDTFLFYAGSYGGNLTLYNHRNGERRDVRVWPVNPMGHSSEDIDERFQWTFPIVTSPHDPETIYVGSQHLWKTTNRGQSWERVSPDLTRADAETMGPSGGPITLDQTGVETYATIFSVVPSPHEENTIWVGSDDGYVHVTRDGGQNWDNITPPDLGDFSRISLIEVSPHRPGKAYMAANRYQMDDRAPYLYRTDDFGESWTKIVEGIEDGHFARAIREDTQREGLLFAGTEHGIYVSWDDGGSWQPLDQNLPDVQVSGIVVEDQDLVIGTHGRSFWIMEDIAVLRQLGPDVADAGLYVYEPSDPVRRVDNGVGVYYYLSEPAEEVTIEFLDPAGELIESYTGEPEPPDESDEDTDADEGEEERDEEEEDEEGDDEDDEDEEEDKPSVEAGLNRFAWDLRYPGYVEFDDMVFWAARGAGPLAVPGDGYRVRVTADGRTEERGFGVRMDPRLEDVRSADLQAQFDLSIQIRDRVTEANEGVLLSRGIKEQIDARIEEAGEDAVTEAGEAFKSLLTEVEGEIYQIRNESRQDPLNFPIKLNNKIAALLGVVQSAEAGPTDQSYEVFEHLSRLLQEQLDALDGVIEEELPGFNTLLEEHGLAPVERRMLGEEAERPVTLRSDQVGNGHDYLGGL